MFSQSTRRPNLRPHSARRHLSHTAFVPNTTPLIRRRAEKGRTLTSEHVMEFSLFCGVRLLLTRCQANRAGNHRLRPNNGALSQTSTYILLFLEPFLAATLWTRNYSNAMQHRCPLAFRTVLDRPEARDHCLRSRIYDKCDESNLFKSVMCPNRTGRESQSTRPPKSAITFM